MLRTILRIAFIAVLAIVLLRLVGKFLALVLPIMFTGVAILLIAWLLLRLARRRRPEFVEEEREVSFARRCRRKLARVESRIEALETTLFGRF